MQIHHLVVGYLQTNCFIFIEPTSKEAWIIDPGGNAGDILNLLTQEGARLTRIINTHAHFDHILAIPELQEATAATFHLHRDEQPVLAYAPQAVRSWLGWEWGPPPAVDSFLEHGDILTLGDLQLEVRHVPGHSPGSVIFVDHAGKRAWVGDTLFREGMGRTDLPGGNHAQLVQAIHAQILTLPDDFTLYPGHGPFTTVGHERRHNPFIAPDLWIG
ncbi:MAG TPA: MBL fold metallo-hydrolase [Anaerolineae bacterium]|nr:MBL fold metallo-hydrolase [Anaerolineae bacterium]